MMHGMRCILVPASACISQSWTLRESSPKCWVCVEPEDHLPGESKTEEKDGQIGLGVVPKNVQSQVQMSWAEDCGENVCKEKSGREKGWAGRSEGGHEGRITPRGGMTGKTRRRDSEDVFLRWGELAPEWQNYCKACLWASHWLLNRLSQAPEALMAQEWSGNYFTVPSGLCHDVLTALEVLSTPCQSLGYFPIAQCLGWTKLR